MWSPPKRVAAIAAGSRIFCIAVIVVASNLSPGHLHTTTCLLDPSLPCYRTHSREPGFLLKRCRHTLPIKGGDEQASPYSWLWQSLMPFIRWDSEQFAAISQQSLQRLYCGESGGGVVDTLYGGYYHLHQRAFFPLIPIVLNVCGNIFSKLGVSMGLLPPGMSSHLLLSILCGVLLSNLAFVVAAVGVFYWSQNALQIAGLGRRDVKDDALGASFLFSVSAANVFASSLYTESVFACCAVWGLIALQKIEQQTEKSWVRRMPLRVSSTLLFTCAASTRSNGILLLVPLFFHTLRTSPVPHVAWLWRRRQTQALSVAKESASVTTSDTDAHHHTTGEVVVHWSVALAQAILITIPSLVVLGTAYQINCTLKPDRLSLRGLVFNAVAFVVRVILGDHESRSVTNPEWCFHRIPSVYGFVQQTVWNVKPFGYWRRSKAHLFLLSFPFYLIAAQAVQWFTVHTTEKGLQRLRWVLHPWFGDACMLGIVALIMFTTANVEVFIRVVLSCPLYFTFLGHASNQQKRSGGRHVIFSTYLVFHLACFFLGPCLHSTWVTWT
eukprot:GHVN01072951.1.p1 GENE.GHVN01072951.1~~GHVN01072951.1.p1  ORF type:complete len:560 (+),score=19.16 GHVN01072951.1:23-1681(+)